MTPVILLLLWLAAFPDAAASQEAVQTFTRITPETGLSQNSIFDIVQDRDGFLWVATSEGLNRYDGYRFVSYRHDSRDPASLPDNRVHTVFEDRAGTLWVGTAGGLSKFDVRAGRFMRIEVSGHSDPLLVWQILEDRAGVVWIGTSAGVGRLDNARVRARLYPAPRTATRLHEDAAGTLWVFASAPFDTYRYDRDADRFAAKDTVISTLSHAPSTWPNLHSGPAGILWIGSSSGLAKVDLSRNDLQVVAVTPEPSSILEDSRGGVWLGSDEIYRYLPSTRQLEQFAIENSGPNALSTVRAFFEDRAGTVWVATLGGLYRWDPHARHFALHTHQQDNPNSLSSNLVSAIARDARGTLWVGTIGGGLNRVDESWKRVTRFRHDAANRTSLASDVVWALHKDAHGRLWAGTDDGLSVLNERTGRFRVARCPRDAYEGFLHNSVSSIVDGSDGTLWLGLYGGRLARFDTSTFTCRIVQIYPQSAGRAMEVGSTVVYRDRAESLWVGVEGGGLQHFDPGTGQAKNYRFNANEPSSLPGRTVWAIHQTTNDSLWLGTDVGLIRFDPATESFTPVWEPDLPSSVVYSIVEDHDHRLWLSTNSGLCAFDPRAPAGHQFEAFTAADGLENTEFNRRAALRASDRELFFGGIQGLISFDPAQILQKNPVAPPVVVTDVETRNRQGSRSINPAVDRVTLSYQDYSLAFNFVALSFTNPTKNRYAYKLEGFDPDWIGPSSRRIAQYTNVPPGTYLFRVKGSNNDGVWNETGAALQVLITPPFWQRWWFRSLAVGAMAAILVMAHRYRVRQVLAIERIRRQVATDLHDDVGSALSQVAILSEVAKREASPAAAALMTETATLARAMRESLGDIVWAVDPRKDHLADLVHRMRQVAVNGLESDGVEVEFRAPADGEIERIGLPPDRRRHVLLIFKEAITNIGRHAHASRVSIDLSVRGRTLSLTISDDGRGFDSRSRFDGHGQQSMARRAGELGAQFALESTPGVGTTIRVDVPLG